LGRRADDACSSEFVPHSLSRLLDFESLPRLDVIVV
jgi:hypothetical protein